MPPEGSLSLWTTDLASPPGWFTVHVRILVAAAGWAQLHILHDSCQRLLGLCIAAHPGWTLPRHAVKLLTRFSLLKSHLLRSLPWMPYLQCRATIYFPLTPDLSHDFPSPLTFHMPLPFWFFFHNAYHYPTKYLFHMFIVCLPPLEWGQRFHHSVPSTRTFWWTRNAVNIC